MFLADTPDEARAAVGRIEAEGWAAVKAYSMLDEATYRALADAARSAGLPFVGHIPERVSLATAIDAGQVGMEHFGRVAMACTTAEEAMLEALRTAIADGADQARVFDIMASRNRIVLDTWDERLCASVLARMAGAGMHVSPTLVVADFYTGNWPAPRHAAHAHDPGPHTRGMGRAGFPAGGDDGRGACIGSGQHRAGPADLPYGPCGGRADPRLHRCLIRQPLSLPRLFAA